MPTREWNRHLTWLLPPSVDEWLPQNHPARFVAEVVEALDDETWRELEAERGRQSVGAPAYDARMLLSVWLYGFMTKVRSTRKLEAACREQLPYLWLTGCQQPDHNTLWRFYLGHRAKMKKLFQRTVRTAVEAGLVNLAVQAVDGTKVHANAAGDRSYDEAGLERVLKRIDGAIADLEAQNRGGQGSSACVLPEELTQQEQLRTRVQEALERVRAADAPRHTNLTDADARLMKGRSGVMPGYNAQAVVAATMPAADGTAGRLIVAADVTTDPNDQGQLVPMLEQAVETTGQPVGTLVADAGYHSGATVAACAERQQVVVMPESQEKALRDPFHKTVFRYDADRHGYLCPQGQFLHWKGPKRRQGGVLQIYQAQAAVCQACPAFGRCTTNRRGRVIEVHPHEAAMRQQREWMKTETAQASYRLRQPLVELVFGILKDQQDARRFLLRGMVNVHAEWLLLATAFNLRTLYRFWRTRLMPPPLSLAAALPS